MTSSDISLFPFLLTQAFSRLGSGKLFSSRLDEIALAAGTDAEDFRLRLLFWGGASLGERSWLRLALPFDAADCAALPDQASLAQVIALLPRPEALVLSLSAERSLPWHEIAWILCLRVPETQTQALLGLSRVAFFLGLLGSRAPEAA